MRRATCIRKVKESIKANLDYRGFCAYADDLNGCCSIICDYVHGFGYSYARIERAFDSEIDVKLNGRFIGFLEDSLRWYFDNYACIRMEGEDEVYDIIMSVMRHCKEQSEFDNRTIAKMRREAEADREIIWDKYFRYKPMKYSLAEVWGKEAA